MKKNGKAKMRELVEGESYLARVFESAYLLTNAHLLCTILTDFCESPTYIPTPQNVQAPDTVIEL